MKSSQVGRWKITKSKDGVNNLQVKIVWKLSVFLDQMPCVWVKEALARKGNKFKIDDVRLTATVSNLKGKLAESSGVDEKLQGIVVYFLLNLTILWHQLWALVVRFPDLFEKRR